MDTPRRMRRRPPRNGAPVHRIARAAAVLTVVAASLSACGALLGIERLPVVDEDATPGDASEAAPTADAGCEASSRSCGCEIHDFCDDFDVDGEAIGARWSGVLGQTNPFTKGDASMAYSEVSLSPPRAVLTTAGEPKSASVSLLAHQLDYAITYPGREFAGFRFSIDFKLEGFTATEVRGPIDSGSAIAASVIHFDGLDAKGVGLVVSTDGAYLLTAASIIAATGIDPDSGDGAIAPLIIADILSFAKTWLRVELVVTDRARAISEGFHTCSTAADGSVVAASIGPARLRQACLALPARVGVDWAKQPVVNAGAVLFGGGSIVLRQDNVKFDFFAP